MKKMITLMIAAAATFVFVSAPAMAAERYRFGGGPSGGGWHPAISAGTQLLNRKLGRKFIVPIPEPKII